MATLAGPRRREASALAIGLLRGRLGAGELLGQALRNNCVRQSGRGCAGRPGQRTCVVHHDQGGDLSGSHDAERGRRRGPAARWWPGRGPSPVHRSSPGGCPPAEMAPQVPVRDHARERAVLATTQVIPSFRSLSARWRRASGKRDPDQGASVPLCMRWATGTTDFLCRVRPPGW